MSSGAHERRVPVEHRWLGLDRRSLPYAAVGFAVLALWGWVMPWVSDQVAWDDPVRAGQTIQVTDDVTMTGAPGWGLVSRLRTTDQTRSGQRSAGQVLLVKDGAVFSILRGPFRQGPERLLAQAERISAAGVGDQEYVVSGDVRNVTTAAGLRGVAQDVSTIRATGTVTAFVVDDVGIEIQVVGAPAQMRALAGEVDSMIDSLARTGGPA